MKLETILECSDYEQRIIETVNCNDMKRIDAFMRQSYDYLSSHPALGPDNTSVKRIYRCFTRIPRPKHSDINGSEMVRLGVVGLLTQIGVPEAPSLV